jgi:hypothetical protein
VELRVHAGVSMGKVQEGVKKHRVSKMVSQAPTMMDMGRYTRAEVRDDFSSIVDWVESRGKEEKIMLSDEETKGSAFDKNPESKQVVEEMVVDTDAQEEAADHVKAVSDRNGKVARSRKKLEEELEEERAKLLVKEKELANLLRLHSLFSEATTSCDGRPPIITKSRENAIPKVSKLPESASKNCVAQATTRQKDLSQLRANYSGQEAQAKGTKAIENKSTIDLSVRGDNDGKFVICGNRQKVPNANSLMQSQPLKSCDCKVNGGCGSDVDVEVDKSTKSHHNVGVVASKPVAKKPMLVNDTNVAEIHAEFENPVVTDSENVDEKVLESKSLFKNNDALTIIIAMNEVDDGKETNRFKCNQPISVEQKKGIKRRDDEINDETQNIKGKDVVPLSRRDLMKTCYTKVDAMKEYPITNNVGYSFLTKDVIHECWVTEHSNDFSDDCRRHHYCHVAIVRRVHLKGGNWSQVGGKKMEHRKRMKKRRKKMERKSQGRLAVTEEGNVMKVEGRKEPDKHLHQERKEIRVGSTLIEEGRYVMTIKGSKGRQLFKPEYGAPRWKQEAAGQPIRLYIP